MSYAPSLPRQDKIVTVGAIFVITALCWYYLYAMAEEMNAGTCAMMQIPAWDMNYFLMMLLMWIIMMVGMMLPTATPMILIYAAVARKAGRQGTPLASTSAFASGYLVMWAVFSIAATFLQFGLDKAALLSPMMVANSPFLGAVILVAAGIYQFMPAKNSCLEHCRSPFHFLSGHWKKGAWGAFRMGLEHGYFCIGCCWVLMLLLFVGGVMNLLWIAAITFFVLLEKIVPLGDTGGRWMGAVMILAGCAFAVIAVS